MDKRTSPLHAPTPPRPKGCSSVASVVILLSFGSALSSVQCKGKRPLGGATLTALGNLSVMEGHQGKPRKEKQKHKGETAAKNCH